jgi:hypothetical protein
MVQQFLWQLAVVAEAAVQKAAAEMVSAAEADKTVALVQIKVAVVQLAVKVVSTVKALKVLQVSPISLVLVAVAVASVAVTEEIFHNKTAFLAVVAEADPALFQLEVQLSTETEQLQETQEMLCVDLLEMVEAQIALQHAVTVAELVELEG